MSMSLQFIVPTSDLHGGIRLPLELAEWLTDSGWMTRVVGPGTRPDWHDAAVPWFSTNLDGSSIPRADVTIATFHTTVGPALRSKSDHTFHLCQGYEGSHPEYREIMDAIDNAYRAPIPKLLVSRHLEAVLNGRYPDCNCHFIGEAVDPRIFFPLGFRRDATPLRVGLVGTFEARVKGIREGLSGSAPPPDPRGCRSCAPSVPPGPCVAPPAAGTRRGGPPLRTHKNYSNTRLSSVQNHSLYHSRL